MVEGLYRETGSGENVEFARVRFADGSELDIQRHEYEAECYEPPFDELPTRSEFEAHHA
ncbi:hypothetical protein [Phenylobacterium sp.]|uniref:hypothetical protein n=1 Tax=Phenylobacterium sp. TaxID=1871053 RepID=UPI0035AF71C0